MNNSQIQKIATALKLKCVLFTAICACNFAVCTKNNVLPDCVISLQQSVLVAALTAPLVQLIQT